MLDTEATWLFCSGHPSNINLPSNISVGSDLSFSFFISDIGSVIWIVRSSNWVSGPVLLRHALLCNVELGVSCKSL